MFESGRGTHNRRPEQDTYRFTTVFGFGKKFKCDTCGAKFSTEAELKEHGKMHMQPMASSGPQQQATAFKCSACGMSFPSQAELMEHNKRAHQKM